MQGILKVLLISLLALASVQAETGGYMTFSPHSTADSDVCELTAKTPVALNPVDFGRDGKCGHCIKVTLPRSHAGKYTVVNLFPQGQQGDLDVLGKQGSGRLATKWSFVPC